MARYRPEIGGVETHAYEVAQRLIQKGHEVQIITESDLSPGAPEFFKKFRIWLALWKRHQLISQADIVHCHDVFFWYLPFRFVYPFKKVYTTFHGYEGVVPPTRKAIIIRRISNMLSHGSINIGSYIQKWYGTKPDLVLYGGIDGLHVSKTTSKTTSKKSETLKIALIGRLSEDIGIRTYVKTLDELTKKGISFEFESYGDGPLRHLLQTYGTVHGFVPAIGEFIKKADIIFTSSYLTILEALSYGKTVVSVFENELKKDYLCDAPFAEWIIVGDDAKILADKIDGDRKRQSIPPELINYLSKNTWDNVTKAYEKLWKA